MWELNDLRPGDIMFGPIGGAAGILVGVGQLILGDITPRHWRVRHVGVVVSAGHGSYWNGQYKYPRLVQAMPRGAEEIELNGNHWTKDYVYLRPRYGVMDRHTGVAVHPEDQALSVAAAARSYVGTPYSFLDYAAIAGVHLGIKDGPIRRRVTSSRHMICSQLADQSMADAGWHVFNDGRLPQDVTPGALFTKMMIMRPATVIEPN